MVLGREDIEGRKFGEDDMERQIKCQGNELQD